MIFSSLRSSKAQKNENGEELKGSVKKGSVTKGSVKKNAVIDLSESGEEEACCMCMSPEEISGLCRAGIPLCAPTLIRGKSFDVILVESDDRKKVRSSDFIFEFYSNKLSNIPKGMTVYVQVVSQKEQNDATMDGSTQTLSKSTTTTTSSEGEEKVAYCFPFDIQENNKNIICFPKNYEQPSDTDEIITPLDLLASALERGTRNPIRYLLVRDSDNTLLGVAHSNIYYWSQNDRVVVCDVDGTVTKSNVSGIIDTIVTEKYTHMHDGVCHFFSSLIDHHNQSISNNEQDKNDSTDDKKMNKGTARMLYLSSRPIALANTTKKFLQKLGQKLPTEKADAEEKCARLPDGPFMGFPGTLAQVGFMEVIAKNVHVFKFSCLLNQVINTFDFSSPSQSADTPITTTATAKQKETIIRNESVEVNEDNDSESPGSPISSCSDSKSSRPSVFIAGFGNTLMDVHAYTLAGMKRSQIYLIDKKSNIACLDNIKEEEELLEYSQEKLISLRDSYSSNRTDSGSPRSISSKESEALKLTRAHKKVLLMSKGTTFKKGYSDKELLPSVREKHL